MLMKPAVRKIMSATEWRTPSKEISSDPTKRSINLGLTDDLF
jgi:hypothetical protein